MKLFRKILYYLGILKLPDYDPKYSRLDGAVLFAYESDFITPAVKSTYNKQSAGDIFIRLPYVADSTFLVAANKAISSGLKVLVLFDNISGYIEFDAAIRRIKEQLPGIKYFQLFNELPHMKYSETKIPDLDTLISITNDYTRCVKALIPDAKVISMSSSNSLSEVHTDWYYTNWDITKRLVIETCTDIVGIHLYANDLDEYLTFEPFELSLDVWLTEHACKTGIRKKIWVTETGIDNCHDHISFYNEWVSRFVMYLKPEKILWYRQAIDKLDMPDAGFALTSHKGISPLWQKFTTL